MSKKKLKIALFFIFSAVLLISWNNLSEEKLDKRFTFNTDLVTIYPNEDWKGTPLDEKGRFRNLNYPFESSLSDLLKWQFSKNPYKPEKKAETRTLWSEYDPELLLGSDDYMIWLGHASYLMRFQGKVYITDPVLFDNMFLKRESALPISPEELPGIDYLLLSHNHRDHCDEKTLKFLFENNPEMTVLTGLGIKQVIEAWADGHRIIEAGWFQDYNLPEGLPTITYLPARHWSKRWLNDDNKSLWGGFFIEHGEYSVYFMGDSGYGPHFKMISQTMGNPDYCLMGVGAFRPEWFMSQAHISPKDAIQAFNEMQGTYFIPMHFGTFDLSDEPRMEPWDILVENESLIQGNLIQPTLGKNLLQKEHQNLTTLSGMSIQNIEQANNQQAEE